MSSEGSAWRLVSPWHHRRRKPAFVRNLKQRGRAATFASGRDHEPSSKFPSPLTNGPIRGRERQNGDIQETMTQWICPQTSWDGRGRSRNAGEPKPSSRRPWRCEERALTKLGRYRSLDKSTNWPYARLSTLFLFPELGHPILGTYVAAFPSARTRWVPSSHAPTTKVDSQRPTDHGAINPSKKQLMPLGGVPVLAEPSPTRDFPEYPNIQAFPSVHGVYASHSRLCLPGPVLSIF